MTLEILSFGLGALLLLTGLFGGGFEVRELKIPKISQSIRVVSMGLGVVFIGLALTNSSVLDKLISALSPSVRMSDIARDTDRPGNDIHGFDLREFDPERCSEACLEDKECKAWAYQIRNNKPRCWVKHTIPNPTDKVGFSSGFKIQPEIPN